MTGIMRTTHAAASLVLFASVLLAAFLWLSQGPRGEPLFVAVLNTAEAELQAIAARLGPRRETAAAGAILGSGRRRRSTMTRKRER